jgi:hypothetical protein
VFGKWLEMTNDSNDKWPCHFISQMTNDSSHLNIMLASTKVLACFASFIFKWNHMMRYQSKSNDWNDQMTKDYVSFDQMTPNPKNGQRPGHFRTLI